MDLGMRSVYLPFLSPREDFLVLRAEQARSGKGRMAPPCFEEWGSPRRAQEGLFYTIRGAAFLGQPEGDS